MGKDIRGVGRPAGGTAMAGAMLTLWGVAVGSAGASLDMNHDIAIPYASALKVLSGQVLYRDFTEPQGALSSWLLAPILGIAPTGGWGLLAASGLLNGAATLVAWAILGRYPGPRDVRISGTLVTSLWFLPIFGAYYYDHLAFLFVLLGFLAYVGLGRGPARAILTGLGFALAFQTKQTVGGPGVLALAVSVVVARGLAAFRDRANYGILLAFLGVNAAFFATFAATGDLGKYLVYSIKTPAEFAALTPQDKSPTVLLTVLFYPFKRVINFQNFKKPLQHYFDLVLVLMYYSYFQLRSQFERERRGVGDDGPAELRPSFLFLFCLLATLWCSATLGRQAIETTFGVGIVFAMAWSTVGRAWVRYGLTAVLCAVPVGYIFLMHGRAQPADPFFMTTQLRPIRIREQPNQFDLKASREVTQYLLDKPGRLAVLDEAAFLVPLALGRPSWGPSSYYNPGLTVPLGDEDKARWQRDFIRTLDDAKVEYLVRVAGFTFNDDPYGRGRPVCCLDLPLLVAHVEGAYEQAFASGLYQVWRRKAGPTGSPRP